MIRPSLLLSLALLPSLLPAEPGRPNILIAVADDWSFPHAGAYGTSWVRTPHFDRIAREGLLFTNAYTPVAKCAASRASLLIGRQPWQSGAAFTHWNFFPIHYRTFPEALATQGYRVGFTGKGWSPGVAVDAEGNPRALTGSNFQARRCTPPTPAISNLDYAANFTDFLDAAPSGQPWCFWFGGNEPHRDYTFGSGKTLGGKSIADIDRVPGFWPDHPDVRNDLLDYAFEVEHFDTHLGRMLAELDRRGQLDNTLVLVTSDNGMPFPRAKGQVYEVSSHLPLAVRWPGGINAPGRTLSDFVAFPDIAPTLFEAAGINPSEAGMSALTGRSLGPLLRSDRSGRVDPSRDHVLLGRERHDPGRPADAGYPVRGIVTDEFLYLHNLAPERWPSGNPETGYLDTDEGATRRLILSQRRTSGETTPQWELSFGLRPEEELYALQDDPDCIRNLAHRPALSSRKESLRTRMQSLLREQGDPRLTGSSPDVFDAHPFANPAFNGLYERWQRGEIRLPPWADPERLPLSRPEDAPPGPGLTHVNRLGVHDPAILTDTPSGFYYIYANYSPRRTWDAALLRSPNGRAGVKAWRSRDLILWEGPFFVF
jgi:N-sulfoglucosamine sulfohydrolase